MAGQLKRGQAALGFSVHTGWAVMVAVAGPATAPAVVDRRRLEIISGNDRERPRFVYHVAQELPLPAARRLVRRSIDLARKQARAALQAALEAIAQQAHDVVGGGIIVGNKPLTAPLETILQSHALLHTAEGALFREAIADALRAVPIPVTEIPARELQPRAAKALRLSDARLTEAVGRLGQAAGRPWAKDHRDATLAALIALA